MFNIYSSDTLGNPNNTVYKKNNHVTDEESLRKAVSNDYVAVMYKNGYRNNENFISTNCLAMDCDNESDDPNQWVTVETIKACMPGVAFAVHYSRNNMKEKKGKAPRPKFHVFFPIDIIKSAQEYKDLKVAVQKTFPFFDPNAVDAARFFFGTENPEVEIVEGDVNIVDFIKTMYTTDIKSNVEVVHEGNRNSHLSHFAGRVLKRYGDTDEAYQAFLNEAEKCDPPLGDKELDTIWKSAGKFYSRIEKEDDYVLPDEFNKEKFEYKPTDFSDVGEAEILAKYCEGKMKFSPATGFLVYNGTYWEESECLAQSLVHRLTELQLSEAQQAVKKVTDKLAKLDTLEMLKMYSERKAYSMMNDAQREAFKDAAIASEYRTFAEGRRFSKSIANALHEVRPMILVMPQDLDGNPYLLCTPNGTYDLSKGLDGFMENNPEHLITKCTSVSPGTKGKELWEKQLEIVFCGDKELVKYVQLICGNILIGKVFNEELYIAYGSGRNCKSTFWNAIANVIGTYSGNLSSDSLTVGCKRNIKPEMAELKGKRLVISAELPEGTRLNTSTVKQLSSTDEVFAEKKYKDPFSFKPSHCIVLYTNYLPKVGALDEGTWRRLVVIPFKAKIEPSGDIKNYADYLVENAGESILAWLIEGAKEVIALNHKIPVPKTVSEAIEAYRNENNWLQQYLDERCESGADFTEKSGELYKDYRAYAVEKGEYARSTTDFYAALAAGGYERKATKKGKFIIGLRIKSVFENEDYFLS